VTRIVNLLDLQLEPMEETPPGHSFSAASVTAVLGARLSGVGVYEIPPGEASWPYHFELAEEEWAIVIEGEVILRTPEGERTLRRGDVVCFPAGAQGAHAFRNAGEQTARFAMPSTVSQYVDGAVYPDSGKIKVKGPGFERRFGLGPEREYWEGEP
jgi:uncharacterized cupin superfamily protein